MFCAPTSDSISENLPADLPKPSGSLNDSTLLHLPKHFKQFRCINLDNWS